MRGDDLVVVMNAYGKHQMQEQETQPQQQGASNKDYINNNFENVPFTDCDNDNNNRSSHQVDCNSNVNSNHDSNDNTNNSDNRSSDNSTDYSNDANIDNCNKSKNTDCNINNNIYDLSDSTNDIGVEDNNPIINSNVNSGHQNSSSNNNYNESCSDNMNETIDCLVTKKFGNASLYIGTSWKHIRDSCPEQGKGELIEIMELLNVDVSVSLICISICI